MNRLHRTSKGTAGSCGKVGVSRDLRQPNALAHRLAATLVSPAAVLLTGVFILLPGCTARTVNMRVSSSVELSDFNSKVIALGEDVNYYEDASQGRFPTGIAVARVIRQLDRDTGEMEETIRLYPFESHEATYWAELFDGTPEIREVVMIHDKSIRQPQVTVPELIDAASIMNTRLLLVYGYDNMNDPGTCTVTGLVYEIPSGKQVASLRHAVALHEAIGAAEELPKRSRPESDEDYDFYMDFLAFRGFEETFKKLTWHLIDHDSGPTELLPNPYENPMPAYPRDWPKR